MAAHIHGNINIQAAWEAYEIASAFDEDPKRIQDVLDSELIYGIYWIWRSQEDIDFAFTRRSPGNTAESLAYTLLVQLDCKSSRDYFGKASNILLRSPNVNLVSGDSQTKVLDALELTAAERDELTSFITSSLKGGYDELTNQ
ncbi:MAG TPA: hypothetical protein DDW52_06305 [Planctomycetaceae bacterium]|nr:hypothetical protein [Planctomycetaceae bacterium]